MTKSSLLIPLFTVFCSTLSLAQQSSTGIKTIEESSSHALTGDEFLDFPAVYPQPMAHYAKSVNEVVIGVTAFDLQTNASVQNRNIDFEDGTFGAAFIFGNASPSFSDRGTGYNYYGGTSWNPNPSLRIETAKAGAPSLIHTAGGTEAVVCHVAGGSGELRINRRNPKGTGNWTESIIPNNTGKTLLWPRATSGGANGNTIHCIAITAPEYNGGTTYQGVDGALLYYRSTDEGATWDIVDYLDTALDATNFLRTRADSYSIFSRGDNVAIAVFNQMADVIILKSSDNGLTWTSQIVNDFTVDLYQVDQGIDLNNDQTADTLATSDESGALLIDYSGMVHLTFGRMLVRDANLTDNQWTFFPQTPELLYWNESMGTGNFSIIATPEDFNNNGLVDDVGDIGRYKTSLCSQSSIGINDDGTLFVVYSGHREDRFTNTQNYRHIYAMKSTDGGNNWSQPIDVTPDTQQAGYEAVYPNITPKVTDRIRLTYMRDLEPGLAVTGEDPYTVNQIMYLDVDTSLISQVGLNESISLDQFVSLFPNPTSDEHVTLSIKNPSNSEMSIDLVDLKGNQIRRIHHGKLTEGEHSFIIQTTELKAGTYLVNISADRGMISKELMVIK